MQPVGLDLWQQAILDALTTDVMKTSAIEGETLDAARVRAFIAWHLGIGDRGVPSEKEHRNGFTTES